MKNLIKLVLVITLTISVSLSWFSPSADATKKVSYMRNTEKAYTYQLIDKAKITYYSVRVSNGVKYWKAVNPYPNAEPYAYYDEEETKKGITSVGEVFLGYPVKKNKTWKDPDRTRSYKIISTTKKVKVKAGTFKKVVVVKTTYKGSKEYSFNYYAPKVGLILSKYNNGKPKSKTIKEQELIKLKNK